MKSKYSEKVQARSINTFKLALGTASYCKSCQALLTHGVNSAGAMKAIGVPSQAWIGWLIKHENYHKSKGETLPEEWTVRGLTQEFKDKVLAPKAKYKPADRSMSQEERAIAYFKGLAGPQVKQANGRDDSKPVLAHFDTTPFAGLK